ncbi:MAG: hypothetical protein ACRBM6_04815 [Geminicoccales bacterium]
MDGTRFKAGEALSTPAGNIDILPTILHLLCMDQPTNIDGRPLLEGLCDKPYANPPYLPALSSRHRTARRIFP